MSVTAIRTFIIIVITSALFACGGGDGSNSILTPTLPTPSPNAAPTLNAGDNQTVNENTLVTLSSVASDSDGTI